MHYHTLAVVTIPPVAEDPEETARIESCIEELETTGRDNPELGIVIRSIFTARLRSQLTAFSRAVFSAVDDLLYPYGTESTECFEFVDRTEEIQESYFNSRIDCIRLPDGKIVSQHHRFVRRRFMIQDGLVYQKNVGPLKQAKRTHTAKKMKALPGYPMTKLYPTLEEFASTFHGCEYDEEQKGYGYYCNPNAMWDWYEIGGRWPITFLVKDSCAESCLGERCWNDSETVYPVPEGYMWVSAARKKDIEWEAMKNWKVEKIRKHYYDLVDMYVNGTIQPPNHFNEENGCVYSCGTLIYRIGESEEDFCHRISADDTRRFPVAFCDLVSTDGWITEVEAYIRPCEIEVKAADWDETVQQYIEDLDDEDVLVSIDYHM